jgi:hypothetical protein
MVGNCNPCPHCNGTGYVRETASATAPREYLIHYELDYYVGASTTCLKRGEKVIDLSIFRAWQDVSLRYLWHAIEFVCRIWFVIERRSDPRWSGKRWRAKT